MIYDSENIMVDEKIQELLEEIQFYLDVEIWSDVSYKDVKNWLNNFVTIDEKKLAYVILNNLVFYSQDAVRSFYNQIFYILIKNSLPDTSLGYQVSLSEWEEFHIKGNVSKLELKYTVIDGVDGLVGKSGQSIIRDFQRRLKIHKRLLVSANELHSLAGNIKSVIIIDDFLGTGEQFHTFYKKYLIGVKAKVVFIPLAATQRGIDYIHSNCCDITVLPVDVIDESYSVTEKCKEIWGPSFDENWLAEVVNKLLVKNKIKLSEDFKLGKGGQALTYASYLSTPNNNISLLWLESDSWKNLLRR